jgi:hypothetical protein
LLVAVAMDVEAMEEAVLPEAQVEDLEELPHLKVMFVIGVASQVISFSTVQPMVTPRMI